MMLRIKRMLGEAARRRADRLSELAHQYGVRGDWGHAHHFAMAAERCRDRFKRLLEK